MKLGSPFVVERDANISRSLENLSEVALDDYMVVEGGPLEGLQCNEKMWIILDAQSAPYNDVEFKITDSSYSPIKHTKVQQEDGRWKLEFTPTSIGMHKVYQVIDKKTQLIHKINVLSTEAQRFVYGYKLYNVGDSLQIVFDAGTFKSSNIISEVRGKFN